MTFEKKIDKQFPDRPLECSECKRAIAIRYTEIIGDVITHTSMCSECPELQKRLHGTNPKEFVANQTGTPAGLECGNCGTTLEEVRRGHQLGCSECYNVFGDVLLIEMQVANRLPSRVMPIKKGVPIHIGRSPGEQVVVNPSSRILALNEALKETLNREDYEQAASLRDQIKALEDSQNLQNPPEEKKNEPTGK